MRESARVMSEEEFKKQIKIKAIRDYEEKIRLLIGKEGIEYEADRKSTRQNSSHSGESRMPSSA